MQMFLSMQRADAGNEPAGVECGKEKAVRQHEVPVEVSVYCQHEVPVEVSVYCQY